MIKVLRNETKHVKVSLAAACVHLADQFGGDVTDAEITEACRVHVTIQKPSPKHSIHDI